jgi:hypothetical protein
MTRLIIFYTTRPKATLELIIHNILSSTDAVKSISNRIQYYRDQQLSKIKKSFNWYRRGKVWFIVVGWGLNRTDINYGR